MTNNVALAVPLTGRQLLEAGAGTGKTFAITTIFLRLILEARLRIGAILTVTYTEAAAAELSNRIRAVLEKTLAALEQDDRSDPILATVLERAAAAAEIKELKRLLALALRDFDEAMICTIHSFCAVTLREFAFENRRLFTMQPAGDLSELIRELVYDYYRLHFYHRDECKAALLKYNDLTPEKLTLFIDRVLSRPGSELEPAALPEPDFDRLRLELAAVGEFWQGERERLIRLVSEAPELSHGKDFYSVENVNRQAAALDALAAGALRPAGLAAVEFFSRTALEQAVTPARKAKGIRPPAHRFFDRCDELAGEFARRSYFQLHALDFVRRELARRREELGLSSYNDLLTDLAAALTDPAAAEAVRRRFGGALIDEFQDTDPVQYQIFDTLFPVEGNRPLFLVGDPKQAIYAFRGADIHTYARARKETGKPWSLDTNYRSERRLVEAVNELFCRPGFSSFASTLVDFPAALRSAGRPEAENRELLIHGESDPAPLKLLHPAPALLEKYGNSRAAGQDFALELTAALLSRMLSDPAQTLSGRPLRPGDFAILIASNRQGPLLKRELAALNIPAVLHRNDNVFASDEAENLRCLLTALLAPERLPAVRQALTLDLFGLTAPELLDEEKLLDYQTAFRTYAENWRRSGFLTAFYCLWSDFAVRRTLLTRPDGERRLTNYQQLAELLHREERQRQLGPYSLSSFFRRAAAAAVEEAELRLESDREAVSIITVHKSKGLQYKIVFCPFLFTFGSKTAAVGEPVSYHAEHNHRPVLTLTPDDAVRAQAEAEHFSEQLRLLYVALTRAENRCLVVSYPTRTPNCLDHIFGSAPELGSRPGSAVQRLEVTEIPAAVPFRPPAEPLAELRLPLLSRRIRSAWQLHSFSSLVRQEAAWQEAVETDYDETAGDEVPTVVEDGGIFAFPGGERTGNCFHRIFERLDFTATDPAAIRQLAAESLTLFGFAATPDLLDPVIGMIGNTLQAELAPGLRLNRIPGGDTLREMRFTFPVNRRGVPARQLQELLQKFSTPEKPYLLPENFSGELLPASLLTGAIDLVFRHRGQYFIADWKSNRIDGSRGSFGPVALALEMSRHSYCLQYLLYIVALDRYLSRRQSDYSYERNFGGVFYCFLRGMAADAPEYGVFRDLKPEPELIRSLARLLPEDSP